MKIFRVAAMITAAVMCMSLSGCGFFATDTLELLSPPSASKEISLISAAIDESADGEYTLKYPARGEYRSAVVQNDLDGDGINEAVAFYSKTENQETVMYADLIIKKENKYVSVSKQKIAAGGVDKVLFDDLDADGVKEILVGWQIYGASDMRLAVYDYKDRILMQRMLRKYTHFDCCDINEDSSNEVLLINFNSSEQRNTASFISIDDSGTTDIYFCELDKAAKNINQPVISHLSSGKTAVYIDEIKGIGAITEVIFVEKNRLVNPLLDSEWGETAATLRSATFMSSDINGDGIIEIPVQHQVPSVGLPNVKENEKLYLTDWCTFNGETLTCQMTTLNNVIDGYYYVLSPKLSGRVAVYKDIDNRKRDIYEYDFEKSSVGSMLLSFAAVKKSEYDKSAVNFEGYELLADNGKTLFLCKISDQAKNRGYTLESVKKDFTVSE